MNNQPIVTLITLAIATVTMNYAWHEERTATSSTLEGKPCFATDSQPTDSWMPGLEVTQAQQMPGCLDCTQYAEFEEDYCESRGTDCDGFWWINESYYWERVKRLYECQDGENTNLYVDCTYWDENGCCNNGSTGVPPTDCSHNGTAACAARTMGGG